MYSGSRRIEGRGAIRRPEDVEYLNTTYLPHDRTVQAVNYYTRRKQQLKRTLEDEGKDVKREEKVQVKDRINGLIGNKGNDPHIANHIKEIHVEPIVSDGKTIEINEQQYHLEEDQKVTVVEQRYFPMQNYYHFVYQSELKKEIYKFANETEAKVMEVVKDRNGEESFSAESAKNDSSHHYIEQPKGTNGSKYQSRVKQNIPTKELVPKHIDYTGSRYGLFTVNENQRMEMSRRR